MEMPTSAHLKLELARHAYEGIQYVVALSWTHVILPVLGGPSLVSMEQLMRHTFSDWYLMFVWLYTIIVTRFCWWWFRYADGEAVLPANATLFQRVWCAAMGYSSTSMAWVAMYMWMCALLGTLPTANPLEALVSAAVCTVLGAAALLTGQRGRGPLAKALREPGKRRLKMVIFFATWMTATVWVATLTAFADTVGLRDRCTAAWFVALGVLSVRWAWLWRGGYTSGAPAAAAAIYPAQLDAGLTVGLIANDTSSNAELLPASFGLAALACAWAATIALQVASSATWTAWTFQTGPTRVAANLLYSMMLSFACIFGVAVARHATQGDPQFAAQRTQVLGAESAALAVAAGWSWYNALASLLPLLTASSWLVRAYGALFVTVCGVAALLPLEPRARSASSVLNAGGSYQPPPGHV